MNAYVRAMESVERIPLEEERISPKLHWGERLMTGLRLRDGIRVAEIENQIGAPPPDQTSRQIEQFVKSGYLVERDDRISLTENGMLISNEIFRDLL